MNQFFDDLPDSIAIKLPEGTRIGNYMIVKPLGIGGVGTVYLARHYLLNNRAAIKIHGFFPNDQYVGKAFLRATNYLSQLNHPHIVRLYDYGFQHGRAYQTMEYIDGMTLSSIIPNIQTDAWFDRCLTYFTQILSAVRYAHNCQYRDFNDSIRREIIHGDIKPHNILIDSSSDTAKLADFMMPDVQVYLSEHSPKLRGLADHTDIFGTPGYMSPEQQQGKVSQLTDVFNLGATLYQLLTNHKPFMIRAGLTPAKVNPEVPSWLNDLVIQAMDEDPAKRFQSVAEIETAIRKNRDQHNQSITIKIKEFTMGDKFDIKTGNISNVTGQLFIGKFNDVIANLNIAGHGELAEALKTLKEAVMGSQYLSDEKKQEQVEVINQIGEEAAKPQPNKTLLKMLGDELMSGLKAIPDIAKAIAAVAPFLTKLYP